MCARQLPTTYLCLHYAKHVSLARGLICVAQEQTNSAALIYTYPDVTICGLHPVNLWTENTLYTLCPILAQSVAWAKQMEIERTVLIHRLRLG